MRDPSFVEIWKKILDCQERRDEYAHAAHYFKDIDRRIPNLFRAGLGKMFISVFEDIKSIHLETLDLINQAIHILEGK